MPALMEPPPFSPVEPVTEVLHGVPVTDPYRWLEDQESPRTREWIAAQTRYTRSYLDSIPGRERIRESDSGTARCRDLRFAAEGRQSVFLPKTHRWDRNSSVSACAKVWTALMKFSLILRSVGRGHTPRSGRFVFHPDGRLMLYEVKQGGERTGTFELLDIQNREVLPDTLPRGYLRGFAFTPDCRAFYYVHEARAQNRSACGL